MTAHGTDNTFHATVAYWASHARFITPIKMDQEPQINENGMAVIPKDTKIGFYMLKSAVKLTGTPEDKDSMVLPLFTDWTALRRWEGLAKDGQKIHTQVLTFQDVYAMLSVKRKIVSDYIHLLLQMRLCQEQIVYSNG